MHSIRHILKCEASYALTCATTNGHIQKFADVTVTPRRQTHSTSYENVQDIAIVGAGIAGSYAAWRMRNAGLSVSIYEYSNRIGGRCHTVKFPGIPDVNVELGASRFKPLDHRFLNKAVNELGLDVVDYEMGHGAGDDTLYYLRGKHMKYDDLATHAPYNLQPNHRLDPNTLKWKLFKDFTDVDINVDGFASIPNKLYHRSLDGIPLYKQSREAFYFKYLTSDTIQYIQDTEAYDSDFGDISAGLYIARRDPAVPYNPDSLIKTIKSGFQSIPESMVDNFLEASSKHSIRRNLHLRSLTKDDEGHYVLTFQPTQTERGVTKDNLNLPREQIRAKKVMLAVPRVALDNLDWDVLKDPAIKDLIQNSVRDAKAGKMYFAYSDTWWRKLPLACNYAVSTTPLRQTYDYAASPTTGKGVLNVGYPEQYTTVWRDAQQQGNFVPGVEDDSVAMTNVGVDMARKMYAAIFDISVNDMKQPEYAVMSIWDRYPIEASWYTWKPGYIWEDVENKMTRPSTNDDVFIISNIFSKTKRQAWTEGALEIVENTFSKYFPGV